MVLVMARVGTVRAIVEDTPNNNRFTSKGNLSAKVLVRVALPSELEAVFLAECFSKTPSTITERIATIKVCNTFSVAVAVVDTPYQASMPVTISAATAAVLISDGT